MRKSAFINYQLVKPKFSGEYTVRFERGGEYYHEVGDYCIKEKTWSFTSPDVAKHEIIGFMPIPE